MSTPEAAVRETVARMVGSHDCRFFLDVHPIYDEQWTGISTVAGAFARVLLEAAPHHVGFFAGPELVANAAVRDAVGRRSGVFLARDVACGDAYAGPLPLRADRVSIGLFPTVKTVRNMFTYECSIVHDCTTLITPQFHTAGNIAHHMDTILCDLRSDTVTACVSATTAADLLAYLPVDPQDVVVAPNGVALVAEDEAWTDDRLDGTEVEPYLLVLGTREPRKNVALILRLVELFPDITDAFRMVITGKVGWLESEQRISPAIRAQIATGRVLFTGYVSGTARQALLRGAAASVYPSFLEGFGLPVLESLAVGTPCLASITSSMPEVGGDLCRYFDPHSVADLHAAIRRLQAAPPRREPDWAARCAAHAARFTWAGAVDRVLRAIERRMAGPVDRPAGPG